jgi:ribulose bisphosphate carboxylase small subunit
LLAAASANVNVNVNVNMMSPSLLAAAKKQQKDHIAEAKKKKKKQSKDTKTTAVEDASAATAKTTTMKSIASKKKVKKTAATAAATAATTSVVDKKKEGVTDIIASATTDESSTTTASGATTKSASSYKSKSKSKKNTKDTTTTADEDGATDGTPTTTKTKTTTTTTAKKGKSKASSVSATVDVASTNVTTSNTTTDSKAATTAGTATAKKTKAIAAVTKATTKKKTKKITFQDELIQKMFMTCRPYNMKELIQIMGKTTSEASINFCLLSLIDKGWVIKKEFESKSRSKELFWANQVCTDKKSWNLDCMKLPSMDDIHKTRTELGSLQQKQKLLHREIEAIEKTPSNEQLSILCNNSQQEVNVLQHKLTAVQNRISTSSSIAPTKSKKMLPIKKNNNNKPLTPIQIKKRINKMRDEWLKRKRKCMDFVDQLSDGLEKKVKDVVHKILELETDEMEEGNIKIPPRYVV